MWLIQNFIKQLPIYILTLPIALISLSVHETCHAYAAYRLGDPTGRNLGRVTLNPLKHIDPIGFLCMLLFRVGWAKPVMINSRNFSKPKRDMALVGAAGPASNLVLALIFTLLLRVTMIFSKYFEKDLNEAYIGLSFGETYNVSIGFTMLSILAVLMFLGIVLNLSLAVFNLLPVPPLDGSRIFYSFLPTKIYFGLMKYERIIAIVLLALLYLGILSVPLQFLTGAMQDGLFFISGMGKGSELYRQFAVMNNHVMSGLMSIG